MGGSLVFLIILIGAGLEFIISQCSPYYKTEMTRTDPEIYDDPDGDPRITTTTTRTVEGVIRFNLGPYAYVVMGMFVSLIAAFFFLISVVSWPQTGIFVLSAILDILIVIATLIASGFVTVILFIIGFIGELIKADAVTHKFESRYGVSPRNSRY